MSSVGLWCKQCRLYFVVGNIMSRARPYLLCHCLVWIPSSSHCLCEIHRAWSSPMRYSTLRGKTRMSVSEPYGVKLNLYCCNIDYLQKIVLVIILDIFKCIDYHCSEKLSCLIHLIQSQESLLLPMKMSIISSL